MPSLNTVFGKVTFPLDPTQVSYTGATVADPAQAGLADLIVKVLFADLGAAYDVAKQGTSAQDGYIVQTVVPFEPEKWLALSVANQFPMLAVYREDTQIIGHSIQLLARSTEWGIVYIMPESDPVMMGKLDSFRSAIVDRISSVCCTRTHPAYNDGYNFWDSLGFRDMGVTKATPGMMVGATAANQSLITYPSVKITLQTYEIAQDFPPTTVMSDMDVTVNLKDVPTDTTIDEFIEFEADLT